MGYARWVRWEGFGLVRELRDGGLRKLREWEVIKESRVWDEKEV